MCGALSLYLSSSKQTMTQPSPSATTSIFRIAKGSSSRAGGGDPHTSTVSSVGGGSRLLIILSSALWMCALFLYTMYGFLPMSSSSSQMVGGASSSSQSSFTFPLFEEIFWKGMSREMEKIAGPSPPTPWVFVYDLFLPDDDEEGENGMRDVKEQFQQIVNSFAGQENRRLVMFITTIGTMSSRESSSSRSSSEADDASFPARQLVERLCRDARQSSKNKKATMECNYLGHFSHSVQRSSKSNDNHTTSDDKSNKNYQALQSVWEYCQATAVHRTASKQVIYLHNLKFPHNLSPQQQEQLRKATNSNQKNEQDDPIRVAQRAWQFHTTRAVTSRDCLEPLLSPNQTSECALCGLIAHPWPVMHFPGLSFVADCRYIRQLSIPPLAFAERLTAVAAKQLLLRLEGKLAPQSVFHTVLPEEAVLGIGSGYAREHWLTSHPTVTLCDVSPTLDLTNWMTMQGAPPLDRKVFPRMSLREMTRTMPTVGASSSPSGQLLLQALQKDEWKKREVSFLPGLLVKWNELYGNIPSVMKTGRLAIPPTDSWIWDWYPDGPEWRQRIETLGGILPALNDITRPYWGKFA